MVDIDPGTVALLRAHRIERAAMGFELGRPDALVFGDPEDHHRLPESFSWYFRDSVGRCIRRQLRGSAQGGPAAVDTLPVIHLHSLRHTCATLQLAAGVHPKIVQERLGHQTITLDTYSHALPTMQREAATALGNLIYG